nr:glycosyltransferase [Acidobacteriota bacterium]
MRVLFVTYRFPVHTHDAACHTVYRLVRHFSARHDVYLAGLAPSEAWASDRGLVAPYCRAIGTHVLPRAVSGAQAMLSLATDRTPLQVAYYRSSGFAALVKRMVAEHDIDIVYGYHLRSAQYIAGLAVPRVIALQPAQILHFGRRRRIIKDPIRRLPYTIETGRLAGYERDVAARFDRCLLISETDRAAIDPGGTLDNVLFSPHGVDVEHFTPPPGQASEPRTLIFSGALGMDTNSDAVLYFCREILPLVHRAAPDARLFIVGKEPPASVRALASDPRVTVTG